MEKLLPTGQGRLTQGLMLHPADMGWADPAAHEFLGVLISALSNALAPGVQLSHGLTQEQGYRERLLGWTGKLQRESRREASEMS